MKKMKFPHHLIGGLPAAWSGLFFMKTLCLAALLVLPLGGHLLAADPPALIPFQGHLARPSVADPNVFEPVPSGQYDILFTLYAAPVGGESKVWGPELHSEVVVVNGTVNAMLGSVIGFADKIAAEPNFFGRPLYVGITVDADGNPNTADLELVPRQVFLPSVHALNASKLNGADWQTFFNGTDDKGTFTPGTTKAKDALTADHATTAGSATLASTVAAGAIDTTQLADGSVTAVKMATGAGGVGQWTTAANATDVYRPSGNVGIGTASPSRLLHVSKGLSGQPVSGVANLFLDSNTHNWIQINSPNNTGAGITFGRNASAVDAWIQYNSGRAMEFRVAAGERMRIAANGRVGIGTASPSTALHVSSAVSTEISVDSTAATGGKRYTLQSGSTGRFAIIDRDAGVSRFSIESDGKVGIGGVASKGKLQVLGGPLTDPGQGSGATFHNLSGFPSLGQGSTVADNCSIYTDEYILAPYFAAFSDARIKNIQGRSDGIADLSALRRIEITDYTHKDTISKNSRPHKKVIAQQVEQVFPQAVSKSTDVVPDIFKNATYVDGWVTLETDLKVGERVRLVGEKEEGILEVLEIRADAFRTAFTPSTDKVFVYGREVNDFRSVDYEAIAMLNVSATQELARRLEAQEAQLAAKNAELAQLRESNDELSQKLTTLEARDQLLEARLTRLERSSNDVQLTGLKVQSKPTK